MIYKCKKCKNYVDDRSRVCGVCGTPVEKKEQNPAQMTPAYGKSDEDGAVCHIERYQDFWMSDDFRLMHINSGTVKQCGNYIYIYAEKYGSKRIYKFDTRQYLESGVNHLTAADILSIDLKGALWWGVNREGIWSISQSEEAEKEKLTIRLFDEQGALRGKLSTKEGVKLQYIYGSKLYFTLLGDGRVLQCDILKKTKRFVWDFKKEPYYSELEEIWKSRGLGTPELTINFPRVVANENYVVVIYCAYWYDQNGESFFIETTDKMRDALVRQDTYYNNISCCDLNTGKQTLLYGGERYQRGENGEDEIEEEFLYGPFRVLRKKYNFFGKNIDAEGQCVIVGMDMASNEIYFLWRDGEDEAWKFNREWENKIYSATIRDFLIREVEKNKVLCWRLGDAYGISYDGSYFCGDYFYGSNDYFRESPSLHYNNGRMVILGRDSSRVAFGIAFDNIKMYARNHMDRYAVGAWVCADDSDRICSYFTEYREPGDAYNLFAIDTRPLSAERCLHIKEDEFKKTKEDLTAAQDDWGKQEPPQAKPAADSQPVGGGAIRRQERYCIYCGEKLPEEAKFCFTCGKPCEPGKESFDGGRSDRADSGMADTAEKNASRTNSGPDGNGMLSLPEFAQWFGSTTGKGVIPPGTERTLIFPEGTFDPKNSAGGRVTGTSWNQLFICLVNEMNGFTKGGYIEKRYLEEKNAEKQQKFIVEEAFLNNKKSAYLEKYEDSSKALKQWKSWAGQWHKIEGSKYYALTSYSEKDSVKVLLSECRLYLAYLAERFSVKCGVDELKMSFVGGETGSGPLDGAAQFRSGVRQNQ